MRNTLNPYGGVNPLIDKMIGNAYDIVKYVAKYLKEIRYVAENMELVYNSAHGYRAQATVVGDGSGDPLSIEVPASITDYSKIETVSVIAVYDDTTLTMPAPDTFEFNVTGGFVNIQLFSALPQVTEATFRITFIHS